MSNQEQQFYPPENYPPGRYPQQQQNQYYEVHNTVNVDPREQQQQAMYGAPEYYVGQGEKLQPRPPRRRNGFRMLWLPIVLFFIIGGMSYGLFGSHGQFDQHFGDPEHAQVINVGTTPKLVIRDNSGPVRIHTDEGSSNASTVTIRIDKGNKSDPEPAISFDKGSDTLTIKATEQGFINNDIGIDITVPNTSDVQVNDGNGSLQLQGITGNIDAQTGNGSVSADHLNGRVKLSTDDGSIHVSDSHLSGTSTLHSGNGTIEYGGSLAVNGTYTFDTGNESVDVSLPSDAAFNLSADSSNGAVTNDFGHDSVGSGTRPSLNLHTGNGSIDIHKQG